jgi:hypothetical protein
MVTLIDQGLAVSPQIALVAKLPPTKAPTRKSCHPQKAGQGRLPLPWPFDSVQLVVERTRRQLVPSALDNQTACCSGPSVAPVGPVSPCTTKVA